MCSDESYAASAPVEFFVSLRGNDGPFATIAWIQQMVRDLGATQGGPMRVTLRGGIYYLDQTLEFGPQDSGTEDAPVVYAAAVGEKAVISGGQRLEGWRLGEVNGQKAWVVDIPEVKEGRWSFHQLFVNGERRPRTRLPREGFYHIEAVPEHDASQPSDDIYGDPRFVYADTDIQPWHNLQDVEVVVAATCIASRLLIQEVDVENRLVTFDRTSRGAMMYGGSPVYWVENVFEALDTPGQWYLDRPLGRLYYLPKPGEDLEMGPFSIVCLIALRLLSKGKELIPQTTAWYQKQGVTFSDVLAFVRRHIWSSRYNFPMEFLTTFRLSAKTQLIPQPAAWCQKQGDTFFGIPTYVRRYIWASEYVKSAYDAGYVLFPVQEWEAILGLLAAAA